MEAQDKQDVPSGRPGTGAPARARQDRRALPRIPLRGHYTEEARQARLAFLHEQTGVQPTALQDLSLRPGSLTNNVEAMVGAVEVPVGIAGPLLFHGEHAQGLLYAPVATTEGALVTSVIRGSKAISMSGGVVTRVLGQRMMRVPVFVFGSMHEATVFARWIDRSRAELRTRTRLVSAHAELADLEILVLGRSVHVAFVYQTGDAAGQNMTTSCTWEACQWVLAQVEDMAELHLDSFYIEANVSGDKKLTYQTFIRGRGTRVGAECLIPGRVLRRVLKTTPEQLDRTLSEMRDGALAVGMVGFNINTSNLVAGIFAATGQDIACVHESSVSMLRWERDGDGIRAEMLLPSLIIGTVGGGTHLPRQGELLRLMGCAGAGKVARLAEIIAGFSLALDLSTASAVASGEFALAHEKLGRNRPVRWLARAELDAAFFQPGLRQYLDDDGLEVEEAQYLEDDALGSSIITELSARKVDKLLGLFPYRLRYRGRDRGTAGGLDVIVKVKPRDEEVVLMVNAMAGMCGERLAQAHRRHRYRTGFVGCHVRELAIYAHEDPRLRRHTPGVVAVRRDDAREMYVLVLERLKDVILLDSADDVSGWGWAHIEAAIRGIAEVHAVWYGREQALQATDWLGPVLDTGQMVEAMELWRALVAHAAEEHPDWFGEEDVRLHERVVESIPSWWPAIEAMPRTLIHNDFNPRNIALREEAAGLRLCAYDWELATLGLPQHDLAELLCFVLGPDASRGQVQEALALHRRCLAEYVGQPIEEEGWRQGYRLALKDLLVNRFGLYLMAHTFRDYRFLGRALATLRHLLRLEGEG